MGQFAAQSVAVLLLRSQNTDPETFKVPCAPVTNLITIASFVILFVTSKNYYLWGDAPLLECSIALICSGIVVGTCFHCCCKESNPGQQLDQSYPGVVFTNAPEENGVALNEPLIEGDEQF